MSLSPAPPIIILIENSFFLQMSEAIKAALRLVNEDVVGPKMDSLVAAATNVTTEMIAVNSNSSSSTVLRLADFTDSNETKFKALQYSLFTTSFVEVLGGLFFLITAAYILRDKARAEKAVAGN